MLHPNDRIYDRIEPEDPVNSAEYLQQILDRYNIDPHDPIRQLCSRWIDLVGPGLGEFSECLGCENGVLDVVCNHPAQVQLVKMNKREILKRIESAFPEVNISDIRVNTRKH